MKNIVAAIAIAVVFLVAAGAAIGLAYTRSSASDGTLAIGVHDSPIAGETHLYLTISNIELQGSDNNTVTYQKGSVTFDLLSLVNVSKMLGNVSVPSGNYTMIRFSILSATAVIGGVNVTLNVPSLQVKVPLSFEI